MVHRPILLPWMPRRAEIWRNHQIGAGIWIYLKCKVEDLEILSSENHLTRIRLYQPMEYSSGTILHIHGGGWAFCSIETHERASRLLANETSACVVSLEYRLAPENPYPAGLLDCVGVRREILLDRVHALGEHFRQGAGRRRGC